MCSQPFRASARVTLVCMESVAMASVSMGGVIRTSELLARGFSKRAILGAVARGEVIRARSGVFVHPSLSDDERHAISHGGRLGCVSAAAALGLWTLPHRGLHIAVPPSAHASTHPGCAGEVVIHWSGDEAFGAWRRSAPLGASIRDIARCQGEEGALVVIESAMHPSHRLIAEAELERLRRIWPEGRAVLDFVGYRADSGLESLVRWRLHKLGISSVPQYRIDGVGRVDLLVGDRLIIELDGGTHGDALGVAQDRRRDAVSTAAGYRTERYGYQQVIYEWPQVLAAIMSIVRRGEHLRPPVPTAARSADRRRLNRPKAIVDRPHSAD